MSSHSDVKQKWSIWVAITEPRTTWTRCCLQTCSHSCEDKEHINGGMHPHFSSNGGLSSRVVSKNLELSIIVISSVGTSKKTTTRNIAVGIWRSNVDEVPYQYIHCGINPIWRLRQRICINTWCRTQRIPQSWHPSSINSAKHPCETANHSTTSRTSVC